MAYDGDKTINGLDPIDNVTLETEIVVWDEADEEAKKGTVQQLKDVIAEGVSAGVAYKGTRAGYETAKLIPAGEEGFIPDSSLVIITDENRTYVTSGTGAEQTLSLVARVMSAGDGISISNSDVIKADTVIFTGTRAQWEALSTAQKAKFNIVNFTDEMECAYQDIYSTTEVKTNKVWIDGKPIYKKVIVDTTPTHNEEILSNVDNLISLSGFVLWNNSTKYMFPFILPTGNIYVSARLLSTNKIALDVIGATTELTSISAIIEYTKTTD